MELKVYNQKGEEVGRTKLPEEVFGLPWNADLVHQVIGSMRSNRHRPKAKVKGRSEVSGGGRKPWPQKGTGRARHGSSRSPLWRGGGVTHGPGLERITTKKINKKMKTKALFTLLSRKYHDREILGLADLTVDAGKTRQAAATIAALAKVDGVRPIGYKTGRRALVVSAGLDREVRRSFRNLPAVTLVETRNLNPVDVALYQYLVLVAPADNVKLLAQRANV